MDAKTFDPADQSPLVGHNRPPSMAQEAVLRLKDEITPLVERADKLIVSSERAAVIDQDTAGKAADLVRMIRVCTAKITERHDEVKAPYWGTCKILTALSKSHTDRLDEAKRLLEAKINTYQREEQAKAAAERRRQEEARRAAEAEAAAQGAHVPTAAPIEVPAPTRIEGDLGAKVAAKTDWHHEVIDYRALPDAVLLAVGVKEAIDKAIKAQIRAGVREIAGVKIWSEEGVSIR